jgi:hypothetical protein
MDSSIEHPDCRRLLDLGHDARLAVDQGLGFLDILGALHEGERDPIGAEVERELEVVAVLVGERRDRQHDLGHVDAFAVGQHAAGDDAGLGMVLPAAFDRHPQAAVVEQELRAGADRGEDFRMGQGRASPVAGRLVEVEAVGCARLELDPAAFEGADAKLRALQIRQDADRSLDLTLKLPDRHVAFAMLVLRAVAEVQPEDVRASIVKLSNLARVRGARAEGSQNLRFSLSSHGRELIRIRIQR